MGCLLGCFQRDPKYVKLGVNPDYLLTERIIVSAFLDPLPVSVVNILANTLALANGLLVLVLLLVLGRRLLLPRIEKLCERLKWGGFFYRSGVFHNLLHWVALLIALSPIELTNAKLQLALV